MYSGGRTHPSQTAMDALARRDAKEGSYNRDGCCSPWRIKGNKRTKALHIFVRLADDRTRRNHDVTGQQWHQSGVLHRFKYPNLRCLTVPARASACGGNKFVERTTLRGGAICPCVCAITLVRWGEFGACANFHFLRLNKSDEIGVGTGKRMGYRSFFLEIGPKNESGTTFHGTSCAQSPLGRGKFTSLAHFCVETQIRTVRGIV